MAPSLRSTKSFDSAVGLLNIGSAAARRVRGVCAERPVAVWPLTGVRGVGKLPQEAGAKGDMWFRSSSGGSIEADHGER
jgi:hypothetical protein